MKHCCINFVNMETRRNIYDFNTLPDSVLLKIFRYLPIVCRWMFGRVCKKWFKISRDPDPVFWKKLDLYIVWTDIVWPELDNDSYLLIEPKRLEKVLPGSVSSFRLRYEVSQYFDDIEEGLHFVNFMAILQEKCPNLQALTLEYVALRDEESSHVIYLSNISPRNLEILELQHLRTKQLQFKFQDSYFSNIEVFDVSWSDILIDPLIFLQMPRLRELYLAGHDLEKYFFDSIHSVMSNLEILDLKDSFTGFDLFRVVLNYGLNLTELYVCYTDLRDEDFRYLEAANVLPRLKVLCVRGCPVTYRRINSIIKCRFSLTCVYVGDIKKSHLLNSAFDYTRCTSKKIIICDEKRICCDRKKRS